MLPPEQYGVLAIFIAVQMFCGLLLINPVGQHINLHTHTWWDDSTLIGRLKSYTIYILGAAFVGALVSILAIDSDSFIYYSITGGVIFGMIFFGTWNATYIPMLNMLGFRGVSVGLTILTALIGLLSSVLLVCFWPTALAWYGGQAVGMLTGSLGAVYFLGRQFSQAIRSQPRLPLLNKEIVKAYCLPLSLAAGLMWIQLSGYRFVIDSYWGLAQLAFIAVGLQLAGQIWALAESLAMQFLYPFFFRRVSEVSNNTEVELAVSDLLNTLVPVYLLLSGLTIMAAPYLLIILVAPEYSNAWKFIVMGAVVELCRALGNVLSNAAHIKRKTTSLALPYATGATVILLFIVSAGELKADISYAGLALISGAVTMLTAMSINMYKQVRFKLDSLRCSSAVVLMIGMASLVMYLPPAADWLTAIFYLLILSSLVAVFLFLMLWKNPATVRLLNVQLRNS